jgi:hypothetical protein
MVNGEPRIISDPPLIVPFEELFADQVEEAEDRLREVIAAYRITSRRSSPSARPVPARAHRAQGGGCRQRRHPCLHRSAHGTEPSDPLFLQAKEAEASVLEPFIAPSEHEHHGQRVVEGQRLMQVASDLFLGWLTAEGPDGKRRHFYVRQLWDQKGSAS